VIFSRLHHVALLLPSLEGLLSGLAARGWKAGPVDNQPNEGTRETYIGLADPAAEPFGRLLLVQPSGPGPYARALAERGPGLHHVGLAVPDLSSFAAALPASGWYVHPFSLRSGTRLRDLWLFRPGLPTLVEVFETPAGAAPAGTASAALIQGVELPAAEGLRPLLAALSCEAVRPAAGAVPVLHTAAGSLPVDRLLSGR
jgi:hypothetical protein